jgi:hypothetical protein
MLIAVPTSITGTTHIDRYSNKIRDFANGSLHGFPTAKSNVSETFILQKIRKTLTQTTSNDLVTFQTKTIVKNNAGEFDG